MSTTTTNPAPTPLHEVVLISHSPIFFWWPVWLVGFLLAALTYLDNQLMAVVPVGTMAERQRTVEGHDEPRDVLVLPQGKPFPVDKATGAIAHPRLRMAASNSPGMIFAVTLCLVIVITNVHMRGLWSVIVVLAIALTTVLFAIFGWWDPILKGFGLIDIHINALGYLSISFFLFAIWLLTYLVYDRRNRMIFSRGQLRVRAAIGSGERVFDTFGMAVEKHRDDVFRHWLLGFGSGDLTVRAAGTNSEQFEVPNVLSVNRKLEMIQRMLQERQVVGG
ncbi:hypothetical protein SAMN05444166_3285 [Singulisphaera sp. GP187]|uniref:hypothetical protein n=1 Tax=Singulisphaera sp. GP187 TaxID=1882752 RepID=UPI000925A27D|nr:hypothetical protein [Singulisphaera sp. GP187]SIO25725.1 hypothetical protein SAMN05444166_3285 [Singulisphaera sp. GP187]